MTIFEEDPSETAYSIAFDLSLRKSPQIILSCVEWYFNQGAIGKLSEFDCLSFFGSPSAFPIQNFSHSEKESLFQYENLKLEDHAFLHSTHADFSIDCVELVPNWLFKGLSQFSSANFNWLGGMDVFLQSKKPISQSYLKAFIQPQSLDLFIVAEGKIELVNRFPFKTASDCIYFLVLCAQQSSLKLAGDHFILDGFHPKSDEILLSLKQYIQHIDATHFTSQFPNPMPPTLH